MARRAAADGRAKSAGLPVSERKASRRRCPAPWRLSRTSLRAWITTADRSSRAIPARSSGLRGAVPASTTGSTSSLARATMSRPRSVATSCSRRENCCTGQPERFQRDTPRTINRCPPPSASRWQSDHRCAQRLEIHRRAVDDGDDRRRRRTRTWWHPAQCGRRSARAHNEGNPAGRPRCYAHARWSPCPRPGVGRAPRPRVPTTRLALRDFVQRSVRTAGPEARKGRARRPEPSAATGGDRRSKYPGSTTPAAARSGLRRAASTISSMSREADEVDVEERSAPERLAAGRLFVSVSR